MNLKYGKRDKLIIYAIASAVCQALLTGTKIKEMEMEMQTIAPTWQLAWAAWKVNKPVFVQLATVLG